MTFSKIIFCTADSPPTPPGFELEEILGQFSVDCNQTADPRGIILGNLGDPFSFDLDLSNLNGQEADLCARELGANSIGDCTDADLFGGKLNLTGPDENDVINGSIDANGKLGDTVNPNAANIITKGNLEFVKDENGNITIQMGFLRFNFPTLPSNNDSSTADCTGEKTE